LGLII